MLRSTRNFLVEKLWERYLHCNKQMQIVAAQLKKLGVNKLFLDHFAVIDLPSPHSGIPQLQQIFSLLGFEKRGQDYLPEKQNGFLWLAERDTFNAPPQEALPQVVVADFRLDALPSEIRAIIEKYASHVAILDFDEIAALIDATNHDDKNAADKLCQRLLHYFAGRDWPLPTTKEFYQVHEFNELLAWVLIFGRQPNHFTLSVHLLNYFHDLKHFHELVIHKTQLELNNEAGMIKGGKNDGLEQSSTQGVKQAIALADGTIELPLGFVEFVWRYPHKTNPTQWNDYFTDFIAQNANRVIESLYLNN